MSIQSVYIQYSFSIAYLLSGKSSVCLGSVLVLAGKVLGSFRIWEVGGDRIGIVALLLCLVSAKGVHLVVCFLLLELLAQLLQVVEAEVVELLQVLQATIGQGLVAVDGIRDLIYCLMVGDWAVSVTVARLPILCSVSVARGVLLAVIEEALEHSRDLWHVEWVLSLCYVWVLVVHLGCPWGDVAADCRWVLHLSTHSKSQRTCIRLIHILELVEDVVVHGALGALSLWSRTGLALVVN